MTTPSSKLGDLGWVLDDLLRTPHTLRVLLLSSDGLVAAKSTNFDPDLADQMAAAVSGIQSLSRSAAPFADSAGTSELAMFQYPPNGNYLFAMAAGEGTHLAVSAGGQAVVRDVSYAMEETVDRLREQLGVAPRTGAGTAS